MKALLRGLCGGLLLVGLAVLGAAPGGLSAQDKKDPKTDPKVDPKKAPAAVVPELRDKSVGFTTSDGLNLQGYWFQGAALDKQRPDAVMMFPAPGNKVTDTWIILANELSKNNFSVLLFDWRGCGMNAPDTAGSRILENKVRFWNEPYNKQLLTGSQRLIEDKGLDYKTIVGKNQGTYRYRDFLANDLLAARFYLDKQNDNGKCNTNRVWIVTEKDGAQLGLGFIATEFSRNSLYDPKQNVGDANKQFRPRYGLCRADGPVVRHRQPDRVGHVEERAVGRPAERPEGGPRPPGTPADHGHGLRQEGGPVGLQGGHQPDRGRRE